MSESMVDLEGAKFGAINAMRTGNPLYDMMIAMLIPLIFKLIFDGLSSFKPMIDKVLAKFLDVEDNSYVRRICVKEKVTSWGWSFSDGDDRNTVCLKAVTLYLAEKNISYKNACVDLVSLGENNNNNDDDNDDGRSEAGQLKRNYRLTRSAPDAMWVEVEPKLMYHKETKEEDSGGGGSGESHKNKTTTIMIKAPTEKQVDEFIDRSYQWYLNELTKMQDKSRYMYEMHAGTAGAGTEGDSGGAQAKKYRRYQLSDEKTFQSIFFPGKDDLLKLIKHFQDRTGKYSIPGYPHKLGLLCHGPPGTGKTSMIKALANHTQRSIVNVPLARIETNAELMEVMFDQRYHVLGQEVPIKLRFKDIIFVMEDVDAISKIVHRRDGGAGRPADAKEWMPPAAAATKAEVTKSGDGEGASTLTSPQKPEASAERESAPAETPSGAADVADAVEAAVMALTAGPAPAGGEKSTGAAASWGEKKDKLNLSGILNVLDGVVDSPNRMLIMTTNHPEKLDPALIRPGRIDKKFHLTYILGEQAVQMTRHYFQLEQEISEEEACRIKMLVDGDGRRPSLEVTPARLEQFCAEHESVTGLCDALKAMVDEICAPETLGLSRAGSAIGSGGRTRSLVRGNSVSIEEVLAPIAEKAQRW